MTAVQAFNCLLSLFCVGTLKADRTNSTLLRSAEMSFQKRPSVSRTKYCPHLKKKKKTAVSKVYDGEKFYTSDPCQ